MTTEEESGQVTPQPYPSIDTGSLVSSPSNLVHTRRDIVPRDGQSGITVPSVRWRAEDGHWYFYTGTGVLYMDAPSGEGTREVPPMDVPTRPEGTIDWSNFILIYLPRAEAYIAYNRQTQVGWAEDGNNLPTGVELVMDSTDNEALINTVFEQLPWLSEALRTGQQPTSRPTLSMAPWSVGPGESDDPREGSRDEDTDEPDPHHPSPSSPPPPQVQTRAEQYAYLGDPHTRHEESAEDQAEAPPSPPNERSSTTMSAIVEDTGKFIRMMMSEVKRINNNEVKDFSQRRNMLLSRLAKLQANVNSCGYKAGKAQRVMSSIKNRDHYIFHGGLQGHEHLIHKVYAMQSNPKEACLVVETKMIHCPLPISGPEESTAVQVPVGRFKIEIVLGISMKPWDIRMINLERSMKVGSTIDHPHVKAKKPCWGDSLPLFDQAANEFDITQLISLSLNHLTHYNAGNPFVQLLKGWGKFLPEKDKICEYCFKFIKDAKVGSSRMRKGLKWLCKCSRCSCGRIEKRCVGACNIPGLQQNVIEDLGVLRSGMRMRKDVVAKVIVFLKKHTELTHTNIGNMRSSNIVSFWDRAETELREEITRKRTVKTSAVVSGIGH